MEIGSQLLQGLFEMSSEDARELALEERAARKGIAIMLCGLAIFAVLNGIVKDLTKVFPVNEIVFFRGAFGLIPLTCGLTAIETRPRLRFYHAIANLPHVAAMTGTLVFAYIAFATLPLGEVTAIFFLQPVLVAVLSSLYLREIIAPKVWIAVAVGFAGVLLISRPIGFSTDVGVFYALAAAICSAFTMMQQRSLSMRMHTVEILVWFMALSALAMLPSFAVYWVTPTWQQLGFLAVMGLVSGAGQFLLVLPLKFATASRLAPLQYTNLLGGLVVGYLWFSEVPDVAMIIGCAVVVAAAALVVSAGQAAQPQLSSADQNRS
jgi:drug/metabolite transporter (DMT)-like permease